MDKQQPDSSSLCTSSCSGKQELYGAEGALQMPKSSSEHGAQAPLPAVTEQAETDKSQKARCHGCQA